MTLALQPLPSTVRTQALFDGLRSSLGKAWAAVGADGQLTADNMKAPMREIRRALLEADVSLPVVRGFVARVQERALGVRVRPASLFCQGFLCLWLDQCVGVFRDEPPSAVCLMLLRWALLRGWPADHEIGNEIPMR